jgi:hypothetical protein
MFKLTANKVEENSIHITTTEGELLARFLATFRRVSDDSAYASLAQKLCPKGTHLHSISLGSEDVANALGRANTAAAGITLGTAVRMKAREDWHYTYPEAGTVCTVSQIVLSADDLNEIQLKATIDGDTQRLSFPNTVTDLSAWLEVI